jgi:phosphoglycolate phosphatase-like HAD superfamily hydrolase
MSTDIWSLLQRFDVLFWDFDGVIKESVAVKTEAFGKLFESFGEALVERVRRHHEANSGISRLVKIPLYMQWAGAPGGAIEVEHYCEQFSRLVRQSVLDSAWVRGVHEYLQSNYHRQRFALVTATPQIEIEGILEALQISPWFREVSGAPVTKAEAIESVLGRWHCVPSTGLFIGDSEADYQAACETGVQFLLRRTPLNQKLQQRYRGPQCNDFCHG